MARLLLSLLVAALVLPPPPAHAAGTDRRVLVQLRPGATWDAWAASPDDRLRERRRFRHHPPGFVAAVRALARTHGVRVRAVFSRALTGFAASGTPERIARLAADPLVASVDDDPAVRLPAVTPAGTQVVDWGIPAVGADRSSTHAGDGTGELSGVHVYVVDTGVDVTHPDLNVVDHVSFVSGPNTDCNGHGTGVAGIIAARDDDDYTVGVAPGAPITGVKVFSCAGLTFPSLIVQGIDWVTANAVKPAVLNVSAGSLIPLRSVNTAAANAARSGVLVTVAAGNGNPFTGEPVSACSSSPAAAGQNRLGIPNGVVTVGATDPADQEAPFSNHGPCVDLWAPGVDVTTTWLTSEGGTFTGSGTSFAAPYAAGGAALVLARFPTRPAWLVELALLAAGDVPGTTSRDGTAIKRLQVSGF